jgi:hypothetical protein
LKGDKKPKPTTQKKGVNKQPIEKQSSDSITPKQTVEPSHNQPEPSKKTLPTPSSEQRLADLNNNRAMSKHYSKLMRWVNPTSTQFGDDLKSIVISFKASTDMRR